MHVLPKRTLDTDIVRHLGIEGHCQECPCMLYQRERWTDIAWHLGIEGHSDKNVHACGTNKSAGHRHSVTSWD